MIDLNHKQKQALPIKLATLINDLIDGALEREREAQPKREYIGMSELGDECLRRVYYNTINAPRKKLKGSKVRIFETGHVFEAMVFVWLNNAGFSLIASGEYGDQFEVTTANGLIKGHLDGIIFSGPDIGVAYPIGWETKALGDKWWKQIVKNGLEIANPKYYGQMQLYMAYQKLDNFLFTTINKNTEELYPEIIPFDPLSAQAFSDRGVNLIHACREGMPPKRMCPSASFWEAKLCEFVDVCFKDQ